MSLIGPEGRKQLRLAARFAAAGFELAMSIVVGYFGGRYLDRVFETAPYLGYAGLTLGIFAGFRTLFVLAKSAQKQANDSSKDANDTTPEPPA